MSEPFPLRASFKEKIWGSTRLSPWFSDSNRKIGEVWFEAAEELPLLVKMIFTEERLSVQVHPDDEYAAEHDSSRGKTEMWHILRADPGASIAIGLRERVAPERLRELAISGEIEHYLNWVEVKPGDTVFVPARTIHAIGAGLALCEIQQNSDVTYRLYDYGRDRELHLDRSMAVAVADLYRPPEPAAGYIARSDYFAVSELRVNAATEIMPAPDRFELFIALEGQGRFADNPFRLGEVWHSGPGGEPFTIAPETPARFLRVFVP